MCEGARVSLRSLQAVGQTQWIPGSRMMEYLSEPSTGKSHGEAAVLKAHRGPGIRPRSEEVPVLSLSLHLPIWHLFLTGPVILTIFFICACVLSHVRLFVTPWTVGHQAPLSVEFFRQEYWSGLPFPPEGDLPHPGIEPTSPALAGGFLLLVPPGKPIFLCVYLYIFNTDTFWGRGACCTGCRILVP